MDFNVFFKLSSTHLRGHELKIYNPQSQLDVRKYFFSIRVRPIDEWNSLPGSIIHSNTVNTFKAKTDCLFKNREYIYKLLASLLLLATFLVGGLFS